MAPEEISEVGSMFLESKIGRVVLSGEGMGGLGRSAKLCVQKCHQRGWKGKRLLVFKIRFGF